MQDTRCAIVRTQSSLPPILRSSSSHTELSRDSVSAHDESHDSPVRLLIYSTRVLVIAIGLAFGLTTLSMIMIYGVNLPKVSANKLSDAGKSKLVDRYNTYTGGFFSVVGMLCNQVAMLLLPVFLLCFTTSAILNEYKSLVQKWAPVGAAIGASLLLSQGPNAVNVQFESPRIEFIFPVPIQSCALLSGHHHRSLTPHANGPMHGLHFPMLLYQLRRLDMAFH